MSGTTMAPGPSGATGSERRLRSQRSEGLQPQWRQGATASSLIEVDGWKGSLLKASRLLQQFMNQLHSLSFFAAGTELRNGSLNSPCPIQTRLRPGHVESVFTGQ